MSLLTDVASKPRLCWHYGTSNYFYLHFPRRDSGKPCGILLMNDDLAFRSKTLLLKATLLLGLMFCFGRYYVAPAKYSGHDIFNIVQSASYITCVGMTVNFMYGCYKNLLSRRCNISNDRRNVILLSLVLAIVYRLRSNTEQNSP